MALLTSTTTGDIAAAIYSGASPGPTDDLIIATAVTTTSNHTFNSVAAGGTGTLTQTGTNTLTLTGGYSHTTASTFTTVSGALTITGPVTSVCSAFPGTFSGSGSVTINGATSFYDHNNSFCTTLANVVINGNATIATTSLGGGRFFDRCTAVTINGNLLNPGTIGGLNQAYASEVTVNGKLQLGGTNGGGTYNVNPGGTSRSRSQI